MRFGFNAEAKASVEAGRMIGTGFVRRSSRGQLATVDEITADLKRILIVLDTKDENLTAIKIVETIDTLHIRSAVPISEPKPDVHSEN